MSSRGRVDSPVSTASNDVTGISRWLRIAVRIRSSTGLRQESCDVLAGMSINSRYLRTINIYPVNMVEDSVNRRHGERRAEHNTELCFGCQSTRGFWMRRNRLRMNLYRYISFIWEHRYKHSSLDGFKEDYSRGHLCCYQELGCGRWVCSTVTCSYIINVSFLTVS